jgi:hypothetical protein
MNIRPFALNELRENTDEVSVLEIMSSAYSPLKLFPFISGDEPKSSEVETMFAFSIMLPDSVCSFQSLLAAEKEICELCASLANTGNLDL